MATSDDNEIPGLMMRREEPALPPPPPPAPLLPVAPQRPAQLTPDGSRVMNEAIDDLMKLYPGIEAAYKQRQLAVPSKDEIRTALDRQLQGSVDGMTPAQATRELTTIRDNFRQRIGGGPNALRNAQDALRNSTLNLIDSIQRQQIPGPIPPAGIDEPIPLIVPAGQRRDAPAAPPPQRAPLQNPISSLTAQTLLSMAMPRETPEAASTAVTSGLPSNLGKNTTQRL